MRILILNGRSDHGGGPKNTRWVQRLYLGIERCLSRRTTCVVHVTESELREARRLRLCAPMQQRVIQNGVEVPDEAP